MPLYEFVCAECGQPFEALVLSDRKTGEVSCPACHSQNITKQISSFTSKVSGGSSFSFSSSASSSCSTGSV